MGLSQQRPLGPTTSSKTISMPLATKINNREPETIRAEELNPRTIDTRRSEMEGGYC